MRRVDEAVREVLGDAVATDLKDPTGRFRDSHRGADECWTCAKRGSSSACSAPRRERGSATPRGLASAHGIPRRRRIARELRMKHTPGPAVPAGRHAEKAAKLEALIEHVTEDESLMDRNGATAAREEVLTRSARVRASAW